MLVLQVPQWGYQTTSAEKRCLSLLVFLPLTDQTDGSFAL